MQQNTWFTPEGIEDLLPVQAEKLEFYRRALLNELALSGYQLVLPPIAEFTDSLLTGTGRKLALDTCRFTDNESGRMMGVRADMTPQVARIVSNRIKPENGVVRLCYVGEVLKSRNNKAKGSRSPIQLGAELFGHHGVQSDIEIIDLMLSCARLLQLENIELSLGHVGVVQALMDWAGLSELQQADLVDILKRKALPEYQAWISQQKLDATKTHVFEVLPRLAGDAADVMDLAQQTLIGLNDRLDRALAHLSSLLNYLAHTQAMRPHLDLSDLRGFQYHTGVIFACYSLGVGTPLLVAKGGRYDEVCSAFGEAHAATGFSIDLRNILDKLPALPELSAGPVYAPFSEDPTLYMLIRRLREQGRQVIRCYEESAIPPTAARLVQAGGEWLVKSNES
ncbi:MAG: ATP phosphoribosyltransferase regulatory subunit [Thiomicrospira sp.]|jgi:ATP phosphoribosyltransferase regulatory subunit|nr:ATP phosphoribosyltransferase regulatory subunit [Thiomicrospira sp.]